MNGILAGLVELENHEPRLNVAILVAQTLALAALAVIGLRLAARRAKNAPPPSQRGTDRRFA
jgi:hypothetical protein